MTPPHPGQLLAAAVEAMGMTQRTLAGRLGCSIKHVNQIWNGNAGITVPIAVRLEDITSVGAEVWLAAQASYDVALERERQAGRTDQEAQQRAAEAVQKLTGGQ
jgi:addiction module HigA family antidote